MQRSSAIAATISLAGMTFAGLALAPRPASAQAVQIVKVKATEMAAGRYHFDGLPTTLKGGIVQLELTNAGKEGHDLQLLRIDGVHPPAEILKIINSESAPTPSWMHGAGGVGETAPGSVGRATVNVGPGNYVILCTDTNDETHKSHAANGMLMNVTVTGAKASALPTGSTATITAKEYGFEVAGLKAGKNLVQFTNAGKELHHFLMFPILPGKTLADVKTAFASETQSGPPPVDFEKAQGSAVIEKSEGPILTEVNLVAGHYAMVCFMTDRAGGPPHFAKGMVSEVVIK